MIGGLHSKCSIYTDQYLKHVTVSPVARIHGSKDQEVEVGVASVSNTFAASMLLGLFTSAGLKILVLGMGNIFVSGRD